MTARELVQETQALFRAKGLTWTPSSIELVVWAHDNLVRQGVTCDRERLDFLIDVLWVMAQLGLSSESTAEQLDATQEALTTWLEALGWRREWFAQSFAPPA